MSKVATLSQISQDCDNESPIYRSQTEPGTVSGEVHIELDNKLLDYVEELKKPETLLAQTSNQEQQKLENNNRDQKAPLR